MKQDFARPHWGVWFKPYYQKGGIMSKPVFKESKEEAIALAKKIGGFVVYSIAPGEGTVRTARNWGYWVEQEPPNIRTWEQLIYEPPEKEA